MATLRDRVQEAVAGELDAAYPSQDPLPLAVRITEAMFDAMGDVRPCAKCGKSIGPAKVRRGYVLCYSCGRPPAAQLRAALAP